MRVLRRAVLVITELQPGGGERVVVHLAEGLHRRGIETLVICTRHPGPLAEQLKTVPVPVESLGSQRGYDLFLLYKLRRLLHKWHPDVINVHDRASLPYVAAANFARRTPVVYTGHGLLFGQSQRPPFRYRWIRPGLAAMTAVAEEAATKHRRHLGWTREITIIPNGVPDISPDPARREKTRRELGIDPGTIVFLAVGNARPEKGFELLIRAAAGVGSPAVVMIAGQIQDDAYGRMLRQEQPLAGERVRLLGFRSDTAALYSAADVFVLSSRSEGLPMVVLEAMMAGLPVIATRVGGLPQVISPETGVLVDSENVEQLRDAMNALLADGERRRRLGAAARAAALKNYSVDVMVDGYIKVFQTLTA